MKAGVLTTSECFACRCWVTLSLVIGGGGAATAGATPSLELVSSMWTLINAKGESFLKIARSDLGLVILTLTQGLVDREVLQTPLTMVRYCSSSTS